MFYFSHKKWGPFVCCLSADIVTVICDKPEKAQVLLGNVERHETPGLKRIILMDPFDPALLEEGASCGVIVQSMQDVEVRRESVRGQGGWGVV